MSEINNMYKKLKNLDGKAFEDMFSKIMKKKYKRKYQQTQNYGKQGDMKVDGILNDKVAFAIFAPETMNNLQDKAISKFRSDLKGFEKRKNDGEWKSIDEWIFVLKSDRKGIPPKLLEVVGDANNERDNIAIGIWSMDDIYDEIKNLLTPEIPYEVLSEVEMTISTLIKAYQALYKEYDNLNQNTNNLFHRLEVTDGYEENMFESFYSLYSLNVSLNNNRNKYFKHFNDIGCGVDIDELIKLRPPFGESELMTTIIDGFESIGKEKLHNKRLKLCKQILKNIK
ncbi:hypothetical protein [Fusibacter sp. 3D3]|uniref:hypothetical protein n=1 Tax=Fusibacter sp. 3D3 TaxID=1048380 RepID=UPI0008539697|nr:hypothetical protein [Fusibacter sp. 3D3]GAU77122.1 hypothetical protein F3D3_1721 [Fusibacter sp. 3D3]